MNLLRRFFKLAVAVMLGASLAGCYIVPLGWGHGQRGANGYYQGEQRSGQSHDGDFVRPLPQQRNH